MRCVPPIPFPCPSPPLPHTPLKSPSEKDDCVSRGWTFLSYDYRKLLPCTGHDLLQDLQAAFTHYHTVLVPAHNLSATNVFVAGYSAGGYLAQLAASHWEPKPLGLFLVAAQGGKLLSPHHYGLKRRDSSTNPTTTTTTTPSTTTDPPPTEEVATYLAGETRTIGALPQSDATQSAEFWARMRVAQEVWRRGLYLDIVTGISGLGARLRDVAAADDAARERLIPESTRCLFPELLIDETFPPAFVVHGDMDASVLLEESEALVNRLKAKYVLAQLVVIEGCAHQTMVYDMIYRNYMSGVMTFFEGRMVGDEGEDEVVGLGEDEDEEDT